MKTTLRVKSEFAATNPEAALAFQELARECREFEDEMEAARRAGHKITLRLSGSGQELSWKRHLGRRRDH